MRSYLLFTLLVMVLLLVNPSMAEAMQAIGVPQPNCNLHSTAGLENAWLTFVNLSDQPVRLYWLNYEGQEIFYRQLWPGEAHLQQTYLTHPWCVRNSATNQAVFAITTTEKAQVALID